MVRLTSGMTKQRAGRDGEVDVRHDEIEGRA